MDETLIEQYAEAALAEASWKKRKEDLKPLVIGHLREMKLDTLQAAPGTFSIVKSVKYKFSDDIERLKLRQEKALEKAEAKEIEAGVAQAYFAEPTLRFQAKKA